MYSAVVEAPSIGIGKGFAGAVAKGKDILKGRIAGFAANQSSPLKQEAEIQSQAPTPRKEDKPNKENDDQSGSGTPMTGTPMIEQMTERLTPFPIDKCTLSITSLIEVEETVSLHLSSLSTPTVTLSRTHPLTHSLTTTTQSPTCYPPHPPSFPPTGRSEAEKQQQDLDKPKEDYFGILNAIDLPGSTLT